MKVTLLNVMIAIICLVCVMLQWSRFIVQFANHSICRGIVNYITNLVHKSIYIIPSFSVLWVGRMLEASGVLIGSQHRLQESPWGLHMPLACPDGAIVAYAWKRQLAGQAAASAVDRTR